MINPMTSHTLQPGAGDGDNSNFNASLDPWPKGSTGRNPDV